MDKIVELEVNGAKAWINKSDWDAMQAFRAKAEYKWYLFTRYPHLLALHKTRQEMNKDARKLAWIMVGKTKKMAWIPSIFTGKDVAYKMEGMYNKTWMEWKSFTFIRWCTSFDT